MSNPSFSILSVSPDNVDAISVFAVVPSENGPVVLTDSLESELTAFARSVEASTELEAVTRIPSPGGVSRMTVLVGLGKDVATEHTLRLAAGAVSRATKNATHIEFHIPTNTSQEVTAVLEGALLGCYDFDRYKGTSTKTSHRLQHISVVSPIAVDDASVRVSAEKASAVALIKDLVNTPAAHMTPTILAQEALESISGLAITASVMNTTDLEAGQFGGILGVGQGSVNPPCLVRLDYSPVNATRHVSLVGKGITFDTGGLTLKSGAGMVGMKYDMTGAATALAVIRAVACLNAPVRVTAWLCLAENMPSATATRPNDVLRIRNGKTVEVLNTDAEGRLVLADGLAAASEEHPDLIIDIATLTGAARGALGTRTVGVMGNSEDASRLVESARGSGENFWRMPLPEELRAMLNSDVADMINGRPGNSTAGMLLAGVFLSEFVGSTKLSSPETQIPWIHLDIAGTADNAGSGYGFTAPGPTGVTSRALIDFILAGA